MPRPLGGHVFLPNRTIFKLIQDIIGTNHLTKFHYDRTINVASRVLTRKNAPPPDIIRTNLLTKKNATPPGSHVFQPTSISFDLIQDIIGVKLWTKFHEDQTINVASRVFTRKNAPPLDNHVFQANVTIFKLIQDIIKTNLPTKFHEDWTINVASRPYKENCPAPWGPCFFHRWTIFKLVREINETNVLTTFYDDWAKIVTSRVFTRNTAPPPGGHVFQRTGTIFELNQHINWASNVTSIVFTSFKLSRGINGTNVLTKFQEHQTINVASRVFTRQNVDDG
ncbi:hypothetical protein DPMN_037455 [Dreissena polymorpha]|uniref:Uncharacterized protein n=1 Tax=Dreissena polymorpha TaxID=45954 RepID=A0A9D4RP63_DREPO|nr:hypothetical protein DPMN_037455 [Dreissena polymorpha]